MKENFRTALKNWIAGFWKGRTRKTRRTELKNPKECFNVSRVHSANIHGIGSEYSLIHNQFFKTSWQLYSTVTAYFLIVTFIRKELIVIKLCCQFWLWTTESQFTKKIYGVLTDGVWDEDNLGRLNGVNWPNLKATESVSPDMFETFELFEGNVALKNLRNRRKNFQNTKMS